MSPRTKNLLFQLFSVALAGGLLYYVLHDLDTDALWTALRNADYRWLIPLVLLSLFNFWIRALRWKLLVDALPPDPQAKPATIRTAFASLMIGYMVNNAVPRLGELARTGNLAAQEKRPFSAVLGTVAAARVLDMIALVLSLISIPLLFWHHMDTIFNLFDFSRLTQMPWWSWLGIVALFVGMMWALRRFVFNASSGFFHRLKDIGQTFKTGFLTMYHAPQRGWILVITFAMWVGYWGMAYIPFLILQMPDVSLRTAWGVAVLGGLGFILPTPGGIGSYHAFTEYVLVHMFAVAATAATTYALLTHGAQFILFTVIGAICLILQDTRWDALWNPDA